MKKPRIFKAVSGEIIVPGDMIEIIKYRRRLCLEDREELYYVRAQGELLHINLISFSIDELEEDGSKKVRFYSTNKENHDAIILRKI